MTDVTINWFEYLKGKYGKLHPRKTEIRNFDTIEVTKVVEANQKLFINRQEGFVGTGLKKDEFVCNCSDLDDIIVFYKDGTSSTYRYSRKTTSAPSTTAFIATENKVIISSSDST